MTNVLLLCLTLSQPATDAVPVADVVPVAEPSGVPGGVEVPPEGGEVDWVSDKISWIKAKIKAKEYGPATGAIIMLLFSVTHLLMLRMGKKIRNEWYGHLAMATGIAVGLAAKVSGIQVGAGVWDWVWAIVQGAAIGLTAVGAWSYFGKKIFGKWLTKAEEAGNGK